jgi:quercetin dioxygenase-like cupin family protein
LTSGNYSKGEFKMESMNLLDLTEFHPNNPYAKPLHVDKNGRALLFALHPDQSIREHNAPSSPFYIVILKGQGVFTGGDGNEQAFGPGTLLIFGPGENHSIRALEELVFVGFLHGAPGA